MRWRRHQTEPGSDAAEERVRQEKLLDEAKRQTGKIRRLAREVDVAPGDFADLVRLALSPRRPT